jgi:uncharacterized protein (DUF2062 family)
MYIPGLPINRPFDIKRRARLYFKRLIRLKGDPFVLARGVAIGTFVGITPTIPFHTVIVTALCVILRGNLVAGLMTSLLVSNPLTIPIEYFISWKIGKAITKTPISWNEIGQSIMSIMNASFIDSINIICYHGTQVLLSLVLGGVLLAMPLALISYFLALKIYIGIHRKRYLNSRYKIESK